MRVLERLEKLKFLLKVAGGKVEGRKKLQKLAYICQSKGEFLSYDFDFHLYGVYSADLTNDVLLAKEWGILNEKARGNKFDIELLEKPQDSNLLKNSLGFRLVAKLKDEQSTVLEVLSTIIYLDSKGYSGEELDSKLDSLKGHLKNDFPKAWELYKKYFQS